MPRAETAYAGVASVALSAALLCGAALKAPYLFPLAALSPLPLVLQRLRGSVGSAALAALLAGSVLATVFSPEPALLCLLFLFAPGLLMGEAMARGRGLRRGCAWAFALLAVEIGLALLFFGPRMEEMAVHPFDLQRSPQFLQEMKERGLPPERVEDWGEQASVLYGVVSVVYPAAYFILGALGILANAALLRAYLLRRDPGWLEGGEFERVRWPFALTVLFVMAGLSVAVSSLRSAAYNVLLLLAFFFALQGLAVLAFYAHRLAGPPLLRRAVVVLVLVNPWAPQILALMGLFDTWFDFRKWAEPPPSSGA